MSEIEVVVQTRMIPTKELVSKEVGDGHDQAEISVLRE